jgi:hypothetical protein
LSHIRISHEMQTLIHSTTPSHVHNTNRVHEAGAGNVLFGLAIVTLHTEKSWGTVLLQKGNCEIPTHYSLEKHVHQVLKKGK